MAGLWERVKENVEDNVPVHLIVAGLRAYLVNILDNTKGATRIQIRDALNTQLVNPLSTTEQNDLTAMADQLDALANNTLRLIYLADVEYVMIAAEMGIINESKWRNDLGI